MSATNRDEGFVLYGCKGCGSTVVEALLELAGARYERIEVEPWTPGPAAEALRAKNPMLAVPTLVLPGGHVLTESAAIVFALADRFPAARLGPPPDGLARAELYRWTVFLAVSVYAPIVIGDHPDWWIEGDDATRAALKEGTLRRTQKAWGVLEANVTPAPFLLGDTMSALDVYVAMLSRWRPGRAWFAEACPKLAAVAERVEQHPVVREVFARNF